MMLTNFIVMSAVFIAATSNFGAQAIPRPQVNIRDGSTSFVTSDAIVFDGPTSGSRTSLTDPQPGPSNVLDGIVFERGTSGSPISPNPPTQSPAADPMSVPTTVRSEVAQCNTNCMGTPEYNPVCGSNGVTYDNPGRLTCATNCGINVSQLRTGRCPAPSESDTPNSPTPVPASVGPDVILCARNCLVTAQYNPVCGSDGARYNNAELLICVRNCGINVTQLHTGPCTAKASRG